MNVYCLEMLAKFAEKLKATPDGDGTLLDHSLVFYGSGMGNPNVHATDPLPMIALGGARRQGRPPHRAGEEDRDRQPVADGGQPLRQPGWRSSARARARWSSSEHVAPRDARIACGGACRLLAGSRGGAGRRAPTPALDRCRQGWRPGRAFATLVKGGADVNGREVDGTTALHWAVRGDDTEIAALLLGAGADANAANRYGVTPLSLAARNGSGPMLELLLRRGADVQAADARLPTVRRC